MFRALGMFGLAGAFLLISPELRTSVWDEIDAAGKLLQYYSPLSYFGVGLAILAGAMYWVYRSAQPR
jgi:F0F1-type ATP synthase membrane subunit c/vacuolar-type H+-ATPase subunit K